MQEQLRALTLWAPWAWAICYLGKDVENRDWKRGVPQSLVGQRLAIHAGSRAQWTPDVFGQVIDVAQHLQDRDRRLKAQYALRQHFPDKASIVAAAGDFCSCIVAVATVHRVEAPLSGPARMIEWRVSSQSGIYLRDVIVLPEPVAVPRGQLGLWILDSDIAAKVKQQLVGSGSQDEQGQQFLPLPQRSSMSGGSRR